MYIYIYIYVYVYTHVTVYISLSPSLYTYIFHQPYVRRVGGHGPPPPRQDAAAP